MTYRGQVGCKRGLLQKSGTEMTKAKARVGSPGMEKI